MAAGLSILTTATAFSPPSPVRGSSSSSIRSSTGVRGGSAVSGSGIGIGNGGNGDYSVVSPTTTATATATATATPAPMSTIKTPSPTTTTSPESGADLPNSETGDSLIATTGSVPIYRSPKKVDPADGRDKWCGLCEREGHESIECPFEDEF